MCLPPFIKRYSIEILKIICVINSMQVVYLLKQIIYMNNKYSMDYFNVAYAIKYMEKRVEVYAYI